MTDTDKARIEKEARISMMNPPRPYTDNNFITGYKAGALAEHDKARNQAIQDCIDIFKYEFSLSGEDVESEDWALTKRLESLKTKLT